MAFPVIGPDGHPTLWAEIDTPSAADFSEIEQLELRLQTSRKENARTAEVGPRWSQMNLSLCSGSGASPKSPGVLNHKPLPTALEEGWS